MRRARRAHRVTRRVHDPQPACELQLLAVGELVVDRDRVDSLRRGPQERTKESSGRAARRTGRGQVPARTRAASDACAYTTAGAMRMSAAALPAWSAWQWVSTTCLISSTRRPSSWTAIPSASADPGNPVSTRVTCRFRGWRR